MKRVAEDVRLLNASTDRTIHYEFRVAIRQKGRGRPREIIATVIIGYDARSTTYSIQSV